MKYKEIKVKGLKRPVRIMKKSDSILMRLIGFVLKPFTPAFMSIFWTTIAFPFRSTTVYTPTKYDDDPAWGSHKWIADHYSTWIHETGGDGTLEGHALQAQKWTALGLAILYTGPAPWLLVTGLLLLASPSLFGWSPAIAHVVLIAAGALTPLSIGFAWGRWRVERQPYLIGVRRGRSIDRVVALLWSDYLLTWPKPLMKKWFEDNK